MKILKNFFTWTRDNQAKFAAAISAELDKLAALDSPEFTGIPIAPTADSGTNTEQIATTKFVATALADKGDGAADKVSKNGDTITGELKIGLPVGSGGTTFPFTLKGKYSDAPTSSEYIWKLGISTISPIFYIQYTAQLVVGISPTLGIFPASIGPLTLGYSGRPWAKTFTTVLNNGADIAIPTKAGTLALLSDIPETSAADKVSKSGDTITGELVIGNSSESTNLRFIKMSGVTPIGGFITDNGQGLKFGSTNGTLRNELYAMSNGPTLGFYPLKNNAFTLGNSIYKWTGVFAAKLNNGADIEIPNKSGTLALLSDIEDVLRQHGLIS